MKHYIGSQAATETSRTSRTFPLCLRPVLCLILSLVFISACGSRDESGERIIRGHTVFQRGIAHGVGSQRAERYCQLCHGLRLAGGEPFTPSCYQCHGQKWPDHSPDLSPAPSTHTQLYGQWKHHPDSQQAESVCQECHGSQLQGVESTGAPSCYLCHEKVWPDS
ncbi:MAG: hypothetical protein H6618_04365 [Deltaproteobacteria bacterium]|nr:hypothetical protein [Deltaproteobacteria bacterium]